MKRSLWRFSLPALVWPVAGRAEAVDGYNLDGFIQGVVLSLIGVIVAVWIVAARVRKAGKPWGAVVLSVVCLLFVIFLFASAVISTL